MTGTNPLLRNLAQFYKNPVTAIGMKYRVRLALPAVVLTALLLTAGSAPLKAQMDPQFSLYMFNEQIYQPGYVGSAGSTEITVGGRTQWVGIDGQPNTVTAAFNTPIAVLRGAAGLHLTYDRIGPFASTSVKGAYAFKIPIGRKGMALQIGIAPGFFFKQLDGTQWITPENNGNPYLDPVLRDISTNVSQIAFDLGAGIYFYQAPANERQNGNKFWVGFSADHLTEPKLGKFSSSSSSEEFTIKRAFYGSAGYRIGNGPISFVPSVLFKLQGPQYQLDVNATMHIRPLIFGLAYRGLMNTESVVGILGFRASQRLLIAYSYDYCISGLNAATSGSHEIVLQYRFPRVYKIRPVNLDTKHLPNIR